MKLIPNDEPIDDKEITQKDKEEEDVNSEEKEEKTDSNEVVSKEMKKLLIRQLAHELKNHNLYKMYALYFNKEGLFKLSKYYTSRAAEELVHYEWIQTYLLDCDVALENDFSIEANANKTPNHITLFEDTVTREIETTEMINEMVCVAKQEKDYKTFNFLHKNLIPEQVEEEKTSRQVLQIAKMDTDWITKQDSIVELYGK